ncbi:MAG: protein-disulfide reductase DsbD domain-containing protein [Vicinamibacterales bacterium]
MRHLAVLCLAGLAAAVTTTTMAQSSRSSGPIDAPPIQLATDVPARQLALRTGVDRGRVDAGAALTLIVAVAPRSRMHVYAPGEPDYIPIELKLDDSRTFTAGKPVYPPASNLFLPAIGQRVHVYAAPFRISQPITVAPARALAELAQTDRPLAISGTLTYQACDDAVCYRPESVPLQWKIPIGPAK